MLFPLLIALPLFLSEGKGKLTVLISVDQMRADYLDRFRPVFTGAFKRFIDEGSVFPHCEFAHANSETGPGHATISTGRHPRGSGIIENQWYDRENKKFVYCTEDSQAKPLAGIGSGSPKNLLVESLGDWIKTADPKSKVISIGGKDRAAILLGGKHSDWALWYSSANGNFGSSSYYGEKLPLWVTDWNQKVGASSFSSQRWDRLFEEKKFLEWGASADRSEGEFIHVFGKYWFPYELSEKSDELFKEIYYTPFLDELCLSLAKEAVIQEKLGQRENLDLLCLGFSALDTIGHGCGPNSQEAMDCLLRLDRSLDQFLHFLEEKIGKDKLLVTVSADHGVISLPEWSQTKGLPGKRIPNKEVQQLDACQKAVKSRFPDQALILASDLRTVYLDHELSKKMNLKSEELAESIAAEARKLEYVHSVYLANELETKKDKDPIAALLWNSYLPNRSGDLFYVGKENYYISEYRTGTGHGTVWAYDRIVPWLLWGNGIPKATRKEKTLVVDIAPTLADFLQIPKPQNLDGKAQLLAPPR